MRLVNVLYALAIAAAAVSCSSSAEAVSPAAQPKPAQPRNIVCERFKLLNENAVCSPEYTDVGEHHAHTATITLDKQFMSCAINDATVSVVCGDLIVVSQREQSTPKAQPEQKK